MAYELLYTPERTTRQALLEAPGLRVIEFGTNWCGHCMAAQPHIERVLAPRPDVAHTKVEDGPGRPLGRAFRVKLWPTLVFLRDGEEVARVVRPDGAAPIEAALRALTP